MPSDYQSISEWSSVTGSVEIEEEIVFIPDNITLEKLVSQLKVNELGIDAECSEDFEPLHDFALEYEETKYQVFRKINHLIDRLSGTHMRTDKANQKAHPFNRNGAHPFAADVHIGLEDSAKMSSHCQDDQLNIRVRKLRNANAEKDIIIRSMQERIDQLRNEQMQYQHNLLKMIETSANLLNHQADELAKYWKLLGTINHRMEDLSRGVTAPSSTGTSRGDFLASCFSHVQLENLGFAPEQDPPTTFNYPPAYDENIGAMNELLSVPIVENSKLKGTGLRLLDQEQEKLNHRRLQRSRIPILRKGLGCQVPDDPQF